MAQSTIMAAANTVGTTSSDVTVGAGESVTIGLFVSSGNIAVGASFPVFIDTPGADVPVTILDVSNPAHVISGPCTARVVRNGTGGTATGVFLEDGS